MRTVRSINGSGSPLADHCLHIYYLSAKHRWRRSLNRYTCIHCGYETRRYNSLDFWMGRPVHPYMSVAAAPFIIGEDS